MGCVSAPHVGLILEALLQEYGLVIGENLLRLSFCRGQNSASIQISASRKEILPQSMVTLHPTPQPKEPRSALLPRPLQSSGVVTSQRVGGVAAAAGTVD